MADLRAWRDAAHELPPEGVPVVAMNEAGGVGIMVVTECDDGESPPGLAWCNAYGSLWHNGSKWDCDAEYDDDYRVRYWRPLPDVPTLAELDGVHGVAP